MGEDLTFIGKYIFELFMVLFLVALGIHYRNINTLDDLTKVYAEISATTGGFTSSHYSDLVDDLVKIGYDKENTTISISAKLPDGTNISSKAKNVTDSNYCPRGSKITLVVKSGKKSFFSKVLNWVNIPSDVSFGTSRRVFMSERVE